jgi:predicted RNA-binding Zn-ribbon protein involved in translation (DUF1610 family)
MEKGQYQHAYDEQHRLDFLHPRQRGSTTSSCTWHGSMSPNTDNAVPVFEKCIRCGYSLRGLPANHACPECGLRLYERCASYRVTNARQLMVFCLMIFGGGWVALKHLPHVANLGGASAWEMIGGLAGVVWIVCVPIAAWFIVRSYRRGFEVAITSDGLIVRLPGFSDDRMPCRDIGDASVKDRPAGKPQVACIFLRSKNKTVEIGGVANVFPKRPDVEQFVRQVTERLDSADDEGDPRM